MKSLKCVHKEICREERRQRSKPPEEHVTTLLAWVNVTVSTSLLPCCHQGRDNVAMLFQCFSVWCFVSDLTGPLPTISLRLAGCELWMLRNRIEQKDSLHYTDLVVHGGRQLPHAITFSFVEERTLNSGKSFLNMKKNAVLHAHCCSPRHFTMILKLLRWCERNPIKIHSSQCEPLG